MREEEAILQMIHRFIRSGLTHDVDCAMSFISENVMGVGMNEQGTVGSREELRALLVAQSQTSGCSFKINFPDSKVRYHPPSFATAKLLLNMLMEMDEYATDGRTVTVNWITTSDNDIIIECGKDFQEEMENLQFNLVVD